MKEKKSEEVVHILGATEDVAAVACVKDEKVTFGTLSKPKEGEPTQGELVRLSPRNDGSFRMERLAAGNGPAQVATKRYRDGWETIFGNKKDKYNVN